LRPYQKDAQEAILRERDLGVRSQMVVMATGLGKCVDPDTYVWSDGLRRFGDLWGADYIAGPHRLDKINGWYDDGINPGKKVTTHAGISIDGTLAHRVWIRREDGFEGWCRLEDVRVGDYIGLARGRAHFGLEELLPHDAYLLGRGAADTALCHPERRRAKRAVVEGQSGGGRVAAVPRLHSRSALATLGMTELHASPSARTRLDAGVPEEVLRGTRDTVRNFLLGIFDKAEASTLQLRTNREQLATEVQLLLLGLGVYSRCERVRVLGRRSWLLHVEDSQTFADIVQRGGALAHAESPVWTPITSIEDSAIRRIDCEVDKSHAFVGNGIINHNTIVIATLPDLLGLGENDVTLVIAHRDELIEQTVEKMKFLNPTKKVGIEKAAKRASEDCQIVVATVQSLTGKRLDEFMRRFGSRIELFVIDEAHHAAAPTYRAIVAAIRWRRDDAMIMGFTATPRRADKVGLGDIFQKIVYSLDTAEAVERGYLVPVHAYMVHTQTSLDQVNSRAGDFVVGELAEAIDNQERNRQIIDAYLEKVPGKKALVFAATVAHARNLRDAFAERGIKSLFASGDTPPEERAKVVSDFRKGKAQVLVNCGLYLEGFDVPSIETIINARPTKSQTLYTQITGRGLRPVDEIANVLSDAPDPELRRTLIRQSHKQYAVVLDIVDIARRHELITAPTLWGLPAQIDLEGRDIGDISTLYDKLVELDPKMAARVRTASAIETAVVDLQAAAVARAGVATWQAAGENHWRIVLPPKRIARDRTGKLIPNFDAEFAKLAAEANRINPNGDANGFALRVLNVDKRSIREEGAAIDVRPRGDVYVATVTVGEEPSRDLATGQTLVDALGKADARIASGEIYETVGRRPKGRDGRQRRRRHRRTPVMKRRAS
jgi:superfamily II DNA or RNA helicase